MSEVRNDLQSSQEAYRQKAQEVRDDQQADLARLKEKNREEEAHERSTGEASINHIRQSTKEQVDNLEQQGEQRVRNTRSTYDRRVQDTQKQRDQELHALHQNLDTQKEALSERSKEAFEHQRAVEDREQKTTRDIEKREYNQRSELMKKDQEQIGELRDRLQSQKSKMQDSQRGEFEKVNNTYQRELKQTRTEHEDAMAREKAGHDDRIKTEKERTQARIESERQEFGAREKEIRDKSHDVLSHESEGYQKRITELQKKNDTTFNRERVRGAEATEKTREHYANEVNRLHKEGDEAVGEQKIINQGELTAQNMDYKEQREERALRFEAEKKKAFEIYRTQLAHDQGFFKKSLVEQKAEFDEIYKKNTDDNQDMIIASKTKAAEQAIKEKQKVMSTLGKYNDKASDPFYRVNTIEYSLSESGQFYELTAKIPEKDKEMVKVAVKNDKIVLEGQRRYQDKIDQTTHSMTTSSYQSFREEVPLAHPVREKYATREWKDGVLTVKIPKA